MRLFSSTVEVIALLRHVLAAYPVVLWPEITPSHFADPPTVRSLSQLS